MPTTFDFAPDRTPQENIALFFEYLEGQDPALTAVLREALREMLPLPEPGQERNARRSAANAKVMASLDSSGAGTSGGA